MSSTQEALKRISGFFNQRDENGESNLEKVRRYQKVLRRVETTDKAQSVEAVEALPEAEGLPAGVVLESGKLTGLGIHIFNEDVYPLKSFEIYLRGCELAGRLDLTGCEDMIYLDLYRNRIEEIETGPLPAMRIFGIQDNRISRLDVSGLKICQGIDAGKNRLHELDVSANQELVELYINDNDFTEIDLSHNPKLKYFYCHNNRISELDTRRNPLLRHLNAAANPMKRILSLAPQRKTPLPLELYAEKGGCVGLCFNPVYNAQWKETGEWRQTYFAYPDSGFRFAGWFDPDGHNLSGKVEWTDEYGASRILTARFESC